MSAGAGECLQHLPVALNYLVSALVTARGHIVDQNLQFPVCHTPEAFRHRVASELRGVGGKEVALIETFQPYKGDQWLARLNDLTRSDRHQVPLRLSTNSRTSISMRASSHLEATTPRGIRLLIPNSMDVKYKFSGPIVFYDDRAPLIETLQLLQSKVLDVLDAFKPSFD